MISSAEGATTGRVRLPEPPVCVITDHSMGASDLLARSADACAAGCRWIQLRAPGAATHTLMALASGLRAITSGSGAALVVNDRADVGLAVGADGLHLPTVGMPAAAARTTIGARALLGVSVHSAEEISRLCMEPIDYFQFGPVYATPSKARFGPPQGIPRLREAVAAANGVPVIAVGGIRHDRISELLDTGVAGVAVIGAILHARDVGDATRELLSRAAAFSQYERRR